MPQLDPTWFASQLFWLFVSFMTLYIVLSRAILPPLMAIMAKRRDTVDSDLSLAQGLKIEAEQAKDAYERAIAEARSRSQQLVSEAMLEQKQKSDEAYKALDHEITGKLKDAQRLMTSKKDELMRDLTPVAAELTAMIVDKLTHATSGQSSVSMPKNAKLGS